MKMKAYFTVEATILLPFVFLIMIFLLYLGFFQYNRCLLTQDLYMLAMLESREYYNNNVKMYQEIIKQKEEMERKKYISFKENEMQVEVGTGKVQIKFEGEIVKPFRFLFLTEEKWTINVSTQSKTKNPVFVMRNYKKAIEEGSK